MVFTSGRKRFIVELSYFRTNDVFNNAEMDLQRCCLFGWVSTKISKFKLKQVYATKNTEHLNLKLIWTYVQNLKGFFDLNNC
jgi:hypothetical protein